MPFASGSYSVTCRAYCLRPSARAPCVASFNGSTYNEGALSVRTSMQRRRRPTLCALSPWARTQCALAMCGSDCVPGTFTPSVGMLDGRSTTRSTAVRVTGCRSQYAMRWTRAAPLPRRQAVYPIRLWVFLQPGSIINPNVGRRMSHNREASTPVRYDYSFEISAY